MYRCVICKWSSSFSSCFELFLIRNSLYMSARMRQARRLSGEAPGRVLIVEVDVGVLYP